MPLRTIHICLIAAALIASQPAAFAQITDWDDPDRNRGGEAVDPAARERAKEDEYLLPNLPAAPDWREFYMNASTRNRYFVARDSLAVGQDGAIRYVVRIMSPSGTENISAEGLRCANGERRIYATLRVSDREWVKARDSRWQPVRDNRFNSHAFAFYMGLMCADGVSLAPARVIEALAASFSARSGSPLTGYR